MAPQCTALNVSDQARCGDVATSVNGLFCSFHSRQCQGLYRGYKIRNSRLDALEASPPSYLASASVALANQAFEDVDSEEVLRELYDHLAMKYALLDRVIRARKLHHSRFFALNMDYGHQNYLDVLSSRRSVVARALERLERRVADVLYEHQKWFKWVRQCQDDEETARENEKKKIKREAALFKRHVQDVQARTNELRVRENFKRQEDFLNEAYNTRLSEEEQEAEWDPIENVIEDERGNYIDLIKHILHMTEVVDQNDKRPDQKSTSNEIIAAPISAAPPYTKSSKKSKKSSSKPLIADKAVHDTKSQVRERLRTGVKLSYGRGLHLAGTIDNPVETHEKTAPVPDDEIDVLLANMAEIKQLLFCRLLLSHASVLPAAIKANSVDELLSDKEVTTTDLRDIALKLDDPGLQEIRDACADLARGEEEVDDEGDDSDDSEGTYEVDKNVQRLKKLGLSSKNPPREGIPEKWAPEREKNITKSKQQRQQMSDSLQGPPYESEVEKGRSIIDFGEVDDKGKFRSKKIRVKICGRHIYNYPSESAISRGGWLQFSLIVKDSDLHVAIKLCRHWLEFFELNILANFQYFPAAKWLVWKGDRFRQQLLQMGLIPYMQFEAASDLSEKHQTGSRGQGRRAHSVTEVRNFMCANIKRNDPVSRRFLQYLSMKSNKVVILIRDAKTSKILRSPPDDELWLNRHKSGIGRASKNEWTVREQVGPAFFEQMEKTRQWHFGFKDYFDVYIWDYEAGQLWARLYTTVHETLVKAHRFCEPKDMYKPAASVLRTLTRDPLTMRTRDIKPGEDVLSIWDETQLGKFTTGYYDVKTLLSQHSEGTYPSVFYNEADVLEDAVLFPDESTQGTSVALYSGKINELESFVKKAPDWIRFINDLDTDEELSDSSDSEDDGELLEDGNTDDVNLLENGDGGDCTDEASSDKSDKPGSRAASLDDAISSTLSEKEKQDYSVISNWTPPVKPRENVQADFMTFMDREKSKEFKRSWHAADFSPDAHQKWQEESIMIKQMVEYNIHNKERLEYLHTLRFLDVNPHRNRRTGRDAVEARAMAALFFRPGFAASEFGEPYKESLLLNQPERARNVPSRRPHTSNKFQPKSFWEEWDAYWTRNHRDDPWPLEWDVTIRPIIARLYKAGVIGNAYLPDREIPGRTMAAKSPDGTRDLYIDYRVNLDVLTFPPQIERPPSKDHLIITARQFSKDNPGARFATLRLWSAPHFYPLMVGIDKRYQNAFTDALGRAWEWNFMPKDMPLSETTIHHAASLRIRPFKRVLGHRVTHRRDLFLVMGTDEEDLLRFTTATIFAIQTEPWRLEVDLWRSFVNVDLGFLESLRPEWLD